MEGFDKRSRRVPNTGSMRFPLLLPPLLLAVTVLDGAWLAERFAHGQAVANVLAVAAWLWLYRSSGARLRRLLVLGLLPATVGELIFSLGLGMYEYRLHAIPLYVPVGHTLVYAAVFLIAHAPRVRRQARWLAPLLFLAGGAFSVGWHLLKNDPFGLGCWVAFAVLWLFNPRGRLFFAVMFLVVAYLEQCGTLAGAWVWPPVLFGKLTGVASANPPGGIAVFYALFDLSCLALYFFTRFTVFERWVSRRVAMRPPTTSSSG